MRSTPFHAVLLLLAACGPRGPQSTTDLDTSDADSDADSDSDTDTDADTDADSDADTDADTDPNCGDPTQGPWATHPITAAGATTTGAEYSNDAGVLAVRDAALAASGATPVTLEVDHATVTARGYLPTSATDVTFYFADKDGGMLAYRAVVGAVDPHDVEPGSIVSFTATTVDNYNGTPEVTAISNFVLEAGTNPVYVVDGMDGREVTWANEGLDVVEMWGPLTSDPVSCGGSSSCYDFAYGSHVAEFRSASTVLQKGDCVHWIGPIGQFDGTAQLNTDDFNWFEIY